MKKVFWIKQVIFTTIILFLAAGCKKEEQIPVLSKKSVFDSKTATDTIYVTDELPDFSSILGMFPEVIERDPAIINPKSITLNADITPRNVSTVIFFQYWTDPISDMHFARADQSPVTGNSMIQVSATLTGLKPGTDYSWKVFLFISTGGHVYATGCQLMGFSTPSGIPVVATLPATNIIKSGVTLNGNVYANDVSTAVTFEYGTTTGYGNTVKASQSPISGEKITDVSANITVLTAGTTYHFRAISANTTGTYYGNDLTFKSTNNVPGQATQLPACATDFVTNDSKTGVMLNGSVNAFGFYTKVSFEYGTTLTYGQEVTAHPDAVTQNGDISVSAPITGLTCGTEYHYRLITENSFGISYGNDFTFISGLPPTVLTISISGITDTTAISGGNVIDDGGLAVTDRGVMWGTLEVLQCHCRGLHRTHDGTGPGSYTSNITGLKPNTTYYVISYAINELNWSRGDTISFTTSK
jgi:hypothetical protein